MKFHCGRSRRKEYLEKLSKLQEKANRLKEPTKKFAWLPIRVGEECRWLEPVWVMYPEARVSADYNHYTRKYKMELVLGIRVRIPKEVWALHECAEADLIERGYYNPSPNRRRDLINSGVIKC